MANILLKFLATSCSEGPPVLFISEADKTPDFVRSGTEDENLLDSKSCDSFNNAPALTMALAKSKLAVDALWKSFEITPTITVDLIGRFR